MRTKKLSLFRHFAAQIAGAAALLCALALPAAAQNVQTTGDIRGRALDAEGNGVPGVQVTARNTETGLERSAITADNGIFVLRLLPPGTYDVRAEAIGYAVTTTEDVRVAIGQSAPVNLTLSTQVVELEGLVVEGDAAPIDVSDASVSELVTVEQIEELPALGRDFTDFIALSGQVAVDPGETTGGQFSIAGMSSLQTNLQIDGVDANNAYFGENRGGARIPFVFSLESIEEFQIIANGYDVEYGNYSGGIVNVVTRSGTNEFEGTVYGNLRSDALTGRGFLDEPVEDYSVQQYAARFSGPIIRENAFFLFSVDGQRRREPQLPVTTGLYEANGERSIREVVDGDTVFVADTTSIRELNEFYDILETVYGIDNPESGYESFSTTNDVLTLFGRVDWNINDAHRLSVRHNYATYTNHNEFAPGFDDYYGRSRAENLEDHSHSFVTELSSVFSQNMFNVFRFQYATEERPRNGNELRPALVTTLSNGDLIGYGGTFVAFGNNLDESKLQFIDNFTYAFDEHTVKVGGQAILTDVRNDFLPALPGSCGRGNQGGGIFCFEDLDALREGRPSSYQFNVYQGGQIVPVSEFGATELSVYLQDEWRATPKLTITAGLRHDRTAFDDNPGRVIEVERRFGFPTSEAPVDDDNISPRLSVAYDLFGDGLSVVRAGAGYFFGRVPLVMGGNVLGSQTPVLNLTCAGDPGDPDEPPSPLGYGDWSPQGLNNPITCGETASLSGVPSYVLWHPDFEYPETFKANVGYEGFVAERTRVGVDLTFSRSTNMYTVRNLNLRDAQFTLDAEGGREIYSPRDAFGPSAANTLGSRRFTDIGDVLVNYNDGVAQAFSASFEAQHNLTDDLRVMGSYTYTRSHDNGSIFCCTAIGMFSDPIIGAFGPNNLGGFGDEDFGWGPASFVRNHTFVLSGATELPWDFEVSAIWRIQSGRPYTAAGSGDLNGDGIRFNDRPFIYAPEDLPLATTDPADDVEQRLLYAQHLADNDCIGDHVGEIVPRNSCRTPWTNLLDMRITKFFEMFGDDRAELQLDLFNVMNGLGSLFCDDDEFAEDATSGTCGWGRITNISGANTNVVFAEEFDQGDPDDPADDRILYEVGQNFAREGFLGSNLLLQFQAQLGFKYYF